MHKLQNSFFSDLVDFCEDVFQWLDQDPSNVIVVHCKGGKGVLHEQKREIDNFL